ncbi:MAG: hypothetical protein QOH06_1069 [Acidobacteriota bacterium]|jgi:hypothetical protein|nr:hypothetical protein [Acidobacteriota bacterium]
MSFQRAIDIGIASGLLLLMMACGQTRNRAEDSSLTFELETLRKDAKESQITADRLQAELKALRDENGHLRDESERLALELNELRTAPREEIASRRETPRAASVPTQGAGTASPARVTNGRGLEIVSATARAGEKNSSWWRFGWNIVVQNVSEDDQIEDLEIQFLDRDGYVLDQVREYNLQVPVGSTQTFTGSALIKADVAPRVSSIRPVFR